MKVEAYAGIDPARKRCCTVAEVDADSVIESLQQGLIIVPVSLETAGRVWGLEPVEIYHIALGAPLVAESAPALSPEQIERFRQIVQEIAMDETVGFADAFAIASNHLAYWVSEMPKGKKAQACGSSQTGSNQPDHVKD